MKEQQTEKLKIDLEEFLSAFQWSECQDSSTNYLDTETGKIIFVSENNLMEGDEEILEDERYAEIPKSESHENFRIMEGYISRMEDSELSAKFETILHKPRPFWHFYDLLCQYPKLDEEWKKYELEAIKKRAFTWLSSIGISPESVVWK